ncbi:hypothetical protein SPRG_00343 [Saprolegnia parasitica CBS 223.65]|uniref:holo-[acyl-carrier-protein] synthase n=1 Tax=Saprolegnia parasitica (strain CBS 223.65) TaxID=695850 RepID=A0A067DA23_SAPPC|nr:hypothetical protein SPRG_00343 [Saprolegnia parasitica CBS 223.65]KDO35496.1 hypothetical protein SPRG_00343 [Saprolegnia parasitica CBS 223.65]|eukprot:XP_012193833.1 hypothetical protein SPRG_00343 [Saprolegnia parasitica CBS 223.65]
MTVTAWYIDAGAWAPTPDVWSTLLAYLLPVEREKVQRFRFAKDQKFALLSRLLQRHLVHTAFGTPFDAIHLDRTPHGKPSWPDCPSPTWNYNVSHQERLVAIASADSVRIGVDVVCVTDKPSHVTTESFLATFAAFFGPREWAQIHASPDPLRRFFHLWSLKEAYVKALGVGVGFDLLRVQFDCTDVDASPTLYVDGVASRTWQFHTTPLLDATHLASIALELPADQPRVSVAWQQLPISALLRST